MDYEIINTDKLGGNWPHEYAIARNGVIYLRITGDDPVYRLMTATSGDSFQGYSICQDKERLCSAAILLAKAKNHPELISKDRQGRTYIAPFSVLRRQGVSYEDFVRKDLDDIFRHFFAIYDALGAAEQEIIEG